MNLSDLASIGSFISGVAVTVSVIYLALQVRHAQQTQQASMHQARVERVTNVSIRLARPEMAEILAKASSGARDFSSAEVVQLFQIVRIQVLALDDAFWQSDAGFLDEPSLQTTVLTMKRMMANPVLRAAWNLVEPQVAPNLRQRIQKLVAETPLVQPTDWAVAWRDAQARIGL